MYTIAISNEKGGVAKTTSVVSLAACLADLGNRILAIDLDPQANMTLAFGTEPNREKPNISAAFFKGTAIDQLIYPVSPPLLSIIPSSEELALAERILPSKGKHHGVLRQLLHQTPLPFDFVLIDCPPALGVLTLNAMVAADLLLIPTQPEYFSIYALRNLMACIRQVRSLENLRLTYRLLITMYDRRNRTHRIMGEHLRQSFENGMLKSMIEIDTKLREAPIAGTPITVHAPKSRASHQYRLLAQEIFDYAKETSLQSA
jgi:chromosome partitioning protein